MADLAVITPTRGRAGRFAELIDAVHRTAELDVQAWGGLDRDDPTVADYEACNFIGKANWPEPARLFVGDRRSLSGWTNHLAGMALAWPDPPRYLASLGDDHRPRTAGWDRKLIGAIEDMGGSGIAYGNDLLQGERLPTAWVVSADIVRALGWMMLPALAHMYVDNATLALGSAAGCITYRSDVVIEHLHPVAGKAKWDESYRESNTADRYAADKAAYDAWLIDGLAADVERVRTAVGAVV